MTSRPPLALRLAFAALLAAPIPAAVTSPAVAAETARYAVRVEVDWSAPEGGAEFPANAHWSRLLAVAHAGRYALFADGDTASSGLALLATNGRVSVLEAELAEARRRGRVGAHAVVGGLPSGAGAFDFEIVVADDAPLVSLASMLAPSPDWFAGAGAASLRGEAGWRDALTVPLWVWDAGADSGATFEAPNAETQPRQSVRLLVHPAFLTPDGLRPIGAAHFQRLR